MDEARRVSIVIPTHNRAPSLLRALTALKAQDYPAGLIEVIVVADGCTDDTAAVVGAFRSDFRLVLVEQANLGPGGARNMGAERAEGDLLIFLDDDVEPARGLVTSHMLAHRRASGKTSVVLGYYPTRITFQTGFYRAALLHWWETIFDTMAEPGHRFRYVDMLSGNFSIERDFFDAVGRFNTDLRCHEDYELGIRLIRAGGVFQFDREAWGHHYETSDLRRSLSRKFEEGRADVILGRLYPDLVEQLALSQRGRSVRIMQWLASGKRAGGLLEISLRAGMATAEAFKLRASWRRLIGGLLQLQYWRGAMLAAGSPAALADLVAEGAEIRPPAEPMMEVDLRDGIEDVASNIDAARPTGLLVRYGQETIGVIAHDRQRERLHGGHLKPWLAYNHSYPLLMAMGMERARQPGPPFPATAPLGQTGPSHTEPSAARSGPAVTIIVPAHNAAATLGRTLDSLLAQTHGAWDAILVDDASSDATAEVIAAYTARDRRFRTIAVTANSAAVARNAALREAGAEWLLFLDADDMLDPAMLERMTEALRADPDAGAVHCGWRCIAPSGEIIAEERCPATGDIFPILAYRAPFAIHACIVGRSAIEAAGPFDSSLQTNEDFDLWQRVARLGTRFAAVPETLVTYRIRPDQSWFNSNRHVRDALTVMNRGHSPAHNNKRAGAPPDGLAVHAYYLLLHSAGVAIAHGRPFTELFQTVAAFLTNAKLSPEAALDSDASADALLGAVPMALCRPRSAWPEIWDGVAPALADLLSRVEQASGSAGLRRDTLAALERKISAGLSGDHRIGATVILRIAADRPIEDQRHGDARTLLGAIVYDGADVGQVDLVMVDGLVDGDAIEQAIAAGCAWRILGRYFARHVYPRLSPPDLERLLPDGGAAIARPLAANDPALHDAIGWRTFLTELWGDAAPGDEDQPPLRQWAWNGTLDGATPVDIALPLPTLIERGVAAQIEFRVAGRTQGMFFVPAENGIVTPSRLAAFLSQVYGFDLCRIVVREALVGQAADATSLVERLARKLRSYEPPEMRRVTVPETGKSNVTRFPRSKSIKLDAPLTQ